MGAAAYNRGSKVIARQCAARRAVEFEIMESLNAMPKNERAPKPFGPVHFVPGHGGIWAECPVTGFGYWYATLREAVRSFQVFVTGYDATTQTWRAEP
jgi:hypothetical protein